MRPLYFERKLQCSLPSLSSAPLLSPPSWSALLWCSRTTLTRSSTPSSETLTPITPNTGYGFLSRKEQT
nr:MAG TPA: hypothetical protein [Caudoviricetes sp.]